MEFLICQSKRWIYSSWTKRSHW